MPTVATVGIVGNVAGSPSERINTMKKVIKVCGTCGSQNIAADAFARWNATLQQWEVSAIMDDGHCCDDCEEYCSIEEREI